jgi:hypothetical protein
MKSISNILHLFALAVVAFSSLAAELPPFALVQSITLPDVQGRFDHFSIDSTGQRLFVAALGNNTLEVVDLAAGKLIQSVPGMSKPQGVLYLPETNQVLVANGGDGTLKIIDGTSFTVTHTLPGLPDADNLRLDAYSGVVWVGYGNGALAEVSQSGDRILFNIKLPGHPESFQLESTGSRVFINVPEAKLVAIVDSKTHQLVAKWPMDIYQANFPMAFDELNHRLFVGCRQTPRLVVLNTVNGKPVSDVAIPGDADDLFYDAKRRRIYLSCGTGFIVVIQQTTADTYKPIFKLRTDPGARTCFFSPELDCLYLAVPARGIQRAEIRVFKPR